VDLRRVQQRQGDFAVLAGDEVTDIGADGFDGVPFVRWEQGATMLNNRRGVWGDGTSPPASNHRLDDM
jgi:hypothetical protein